LVDNYRELEQVVKTCQKEFKERKVGDALHWAVVDRQEKGLVNQYRINIETEIHRYLEFQADLRGFWRILQSCVPESCIEEFLFRFQKTDRENESDDSDSDSDNDSGLGEEEGEEPPTKKQQLTEAEQKDADTLQDPRASSTS
jgi:hypothetical protein